MTKSLTELRDLLSGDVLRAPRLEDVGHVAVFAASDRARAMTAEVD